MYIQLLGALLFCILLLWVVFQKTLREIHVPRIRAMNINPTVVTFNIKKFPWSFKSFGRFDIYDVIKDHSIVLLQECFDETFHKLDYYFPEYYIARGTLKGYKLFNSGLAILSKYPILEVEFHPYKICNRCSCDVLSEKGFLSILIDIGTDEPIRIINTHLQSSDYERFDRKAIRQLNQLLVYLSRIRYPYLVGGDFNLDQSLLTMPVSFSNDPTVYIDFTKGTTSATYQPGYEGLCFDYFMNSKLSLDKPVVLNSTFSDHQPVTTRFTIKEKQIEKDVI